MKGLGTYDPATGVETPRIRVTLATGIPRERCERINLGYLDPASVDVEAWKKDPDTLVVPRAGEMLYRLRHVLIHRRDRMKYGLNIRPEAALDFVSLGALVHRLDPGIIPFRKATECADPRQRRRVQRAPPTSPTASA